MADAAARLDVGGLEPGGWTFERREVAEGFDSHVREQLPWYDMATGLVAHLARHFVPVGGRVVDVGASTGNVGRAISATLAARQAGLIAIEPSAAMCGLYSGPGVVFQGDAQDFDFADHAPDLVVCFLSLMFVPVADRAPLLDRMRGSLRPGGALVVVDKLAPRGGELGQIVYRLTLAAKYEAGATPDEIIRKELSLAGVQRPLHPADLDGFREVFRFGDFCAWVALAGGADG